MTSSSFIGILIDEYKIVQDQRNSSRPIVVTILGFALATFVGCGTIYFQKVDGAQWFMVVAPLGLFLPASVALWNAQQEIFLSFYLNAIEGKIRTELSKLGYNKSDIRFDAVSGLTLFSSGALLAESGSSRNKKGYGAITLFSAATVFSAAAIAMVWAGYRSISADPDMRWARLPYCIFYIVAICMLVHYFYQVHIDSRNKFISLAKEYQWRLPEDAYFKTAKRSNYNRFYVPRPGDVIKSIWGVCGVAYYSVIYEFSASLSIQAVVIYVTIFELLFYQTRYLVNDLIGLQEDLNHPAAKIRYRVPRDVDCVALLIKEVVLRGLVAVLILIFLGWNFPLVSLQFSLSLVILILLTCGYEVIKHEESVSSSLWWTYLMFPFVGLGYVLRFFTGAGILVAIGGGSSIRSILKTVEVSLLNPAHMGNVYFIEALGLSLLIVGLTMYSVSLGWLVEAVSWVTYEPSKKTLIVAVPSDSKRHILVAIRRYLNCIGVKCVKDGEAKGGIDGVSESVSALRKFINSQDLSTGRNSKFCLEIWKCPWSWGVLVAFAGMGTYVCAGYNNVNLLWHVEASCLLVVVVVAVLALMAPYEILDCRISVTLCGVFVLCLLCGFFYFRTEGLFFVVAMYVLGMVTGMGAPAYKYESMVKGLGGFISELFSWFTNKTRSLASKIVGQTSSCDIASQS